MADETAELATPTRRLVAPCYSAAGEPTGEVELPASVFGVTPHLAVMHQALVRQLANARHGTASTRTRSTVRGGGAKPYRQKGTGRARQGTTRAPSMVGGAVAAGPHPRDYRQRMPRKMRRLALRSALSVKAAEGKVAVLEGIDLEEPRTRAMADLLLRVGEGASTLLVLPAASDIINRSTANLPWAKALLAYNLNLHDLFTHDRLVIVRDAVQLIADTFAASGREEQAA